MLLGHWIEMRSVISASKALDELVKLMPEEAHVIHENGETMDMPVSSLKTGDRILVKPGEKFQSTARSSPARHPSMKQ